jgi:hypothetical protein
LANNVFQVKRTSTAGRTPNTTGSYATNTQYIGAGEFALNMADQILYTSNGSVVITVGANLVNQNISNTLTVKAISANGGLGTAGQVLTTNASAVYWSTVTGGGGSSVTISSSAPGAPSSGDLWWNSDQGNMKIYYNDGNSSQWVDASRGTPGPTGPMYGSRLVASADATSITPNANTTDVVTQLNTQAVGTLTINAATGTPSDGQKLMFRIKSTNIQTLSWNAVYAGGADLTLPSATSGSSLTDYYGFIYNSGATKWHLLSKISGF